MFRMVIRTRPVRTARPKSDEAVSARIIIIMEQARVSGVRGWP